MSGKKVVVCPKTYTFLSLVGVRKNFKLLKYEHIINHFKARDLEIPLI